MCIRDSVELMHEVEVSEVLLGHTTLIGLADEGLHGTLHGLGDLIDVLGLDDGLDLVLEEVLEVGLVLATTEVLHDLLPGGLGAVLTQIGLDLALEDVKGGGLTSTVGSCLLYTSYAADEEDSVDLGGVRIIIKKIIVS
eukprot:TRINITY_DN47736_c0_g1_i1.p1 TRINITY_DN47736_c0_g1~~TRINITY_DN47736_c0_g1_i1.p1  ORF type:complete len:139 (+),score=5.15 TRINITY_DN47736_c0_g1_i1:48-464(+)